MTYPTQESPVELGRTGLLIPPMGVGTWAWGDRLFWGYGRGGFTDADLRAAFEVSLDAGLNLFDTAEIYGLGLSERILGGFSLSSRQPVVVSTKFFPYPWRMLRSQIARALKQSLKRLGHERVSLYQIHWPYPPRSTDFWVEGLAEVAHSGLALTLGVSNYTTLQQRSAQAILAKHNLVLASNQVEFSLLNRKPERDGLLKTCLEEGVTLIAYSPLGQGMLTGKYGPENPPTGPRGLRYNRASLARIERLIAILREIGQFYGGKTPAQVALNWVICKGAVPIPGVKNARQAQENAGALGWRLSSSDVERLDHASEER